jgi:hypothetical protein
VVNQFLALWRVGFAVGLQSCRAVRLLCNFTSNPENLRSHLMFLRSIACDYRPGATLLANGYGTHVSSQAIQKSTIALSFLRLIACDCRSSFSAAWTALVLMFGSFFIYGIIGMNLFSGLLWHCSNADLPKAPMYNREECEAQEGLVWKNRPFHFDNILEAWNTLFSVWTGSLNPIWTWTMNIRDADTCPDRDCVDQAPQTDGSLLAPFVFFASFMLCVILALFRDFRIRKCRTCP